MSHDAVRCRSCGSGNGELVLDLGAQPACEYFPPLADPVEGDARFPLRLWLCVSCGLAQLADDSDLPDQPEGVEPTALREQRRSAVAAVRAAGLLPEGGTFVEGETPHGGSWRGELATVGLRAAAAGEQADVVVDGSFGLMHALDQRAALRQLVDSLAPDGTLLFQFHSLAAILRERQWNAVRHGHYAYYSLPVVHRMFEQVGLVARGAWSFPLYGGTVLVAARRSGRPDAAVVQLTDAELAAGVLDPGALRKLEDDVVASTTALRALAERARVDGRPLYGYSAASRAVALICSAGLDADLLVGVADASPAKQGCRMPGTAVPVISPEQLVAAGPDRVLLFVPDLLPEVRRALPQIEAGGASWVVPGASSPI